MTTDRQPRPPYHEEETPVTKGARVQEIPAPPDGASFYTAPQVAEILRVRLGTVRNYISRGWRGIKLRTLLIPKGGIAKHDLAVFLEKLNDVHVVFVGALKGETE